MNTSVRTTPFIPDTTQAEDWLTDYIFTWHGKLFKVLPDFTVVPCEPDEALLLSSSAAPSSPDRQPGELPRAVFINGGETCKLKHARP